MKNETRSKAPGSSHALPKGVDPYTSTTSEPYLQGRRDAIAEWRASGGVPQSVVALQVLYCLPDRFVNSYETLFDTATSGGVGSALGSSSASVGKAAGKKNGIVLGSETGMQATGGGKRWKNPTDLLGSAKALDLKRAIDKALDDLATTIIGELRTLQKSGRANEEGSGSGSGSEGRLSPKCRGERCGRFLKREYKYCPSCGTQRG